MTAEQRLRRGLREVRDGLIRAYQTSADKEVDREIQRVQRSLAQAISDADICPRCGESGDCRCP